MSKITAEIWLLLAAAIAIETAAIPAIVHCVNGAEKGLKCECEYGWTGATCEEIVCAHGNAVVDNVDLCINGTGCSSFAKCSCDFAWMGRHCDQQVDDPCKEHREIKLNAAAAAVEETSLKNDSADSRQLADCLARVAADSRWQTQMAATPASPFLLLLLVLFVVVVVAAIVVAFFYVLHGSLTCAKRAPIDDSMELAVVNQREAARPNPLDVEISISGERSELLPHSNSTEQC